MPIIVSPMAKVWSGADEKAEWGLRTADRERGLRIADPDCGLRMMADCRRADKRR
jgi:hypothetical protein